MVVSVTQQYFDLVKKRIMHVMGYQRDIQGKGKSTITDRHMGDKHTKQTSDATIL